MTEETKKDKTDETGVDLKKKTDNQSEFKKILKKDSKLSPIQMIATAMTAVSVAIITTKLTSVVNGLALAAIISVASAVISELYRIIVSMTALGTKKAVAPLANKNEIDKKEKTQALKESDMKVDDPISVRKTIGYYFNKRKYLRASLLFTTTVALTIVVSFFMSKYIDTPSEINQYHPTTVQAERLSDQEKNKIIDEAVAKSSETPKTTSSEESTDPNSSNTGNSQSTNDNTEELKKQNDELEKKIQKLEDNLDKYKKQLDKKNTTSSQKSSNPPEITKKDFDDLQDEIEELRKQIKEINNSSSNKTTSEPSTDGNSSEKQSSKSTSSAKGQSSSTTNKSSPSSSSSTDTSTSSK